MNSKATQQMWTVLGVCLERTRAATAALQKEDFPLFEELLKKRTAAFFNLRALEHRSQLSETFWENPQTQDLVNDILSADSTLETIIKSSQIAVESKLRDTRRDRMGIAKFHSGLKQNSGFNRAI